MKAILFLTLTISAVLTLEYSQASETKETPLEVAAEINGEIITFSDINKILNSHFGTNIGYFDENQKHSLRFEILNKLIDRTLLYQSARRGSEWISEDTIIRKFSKIREQKSEIERQKEYPKLRASIIKDLIIKKYLEKVYSKKLIINDEELITIFEQRKDLFTEPTQARMRHILVKTPKDSTEEETNLLAEKAEQIFKLVAENKNEFPEIAKRHSDSASKSKGGDLGFITKNQLPADFTEKAFRLDEGEISEPFRTELGFHIVKIEEKISVEELKFAEAKTKVKEYLVEKKKGAILKSHLAELKKEAKIIVYMQ